MPFVARWLAERGIRGDVAGQWLGRVTADASDWLVAIAARPEDAVAGSGLEWRALDALAASTPVLDYQQWAVARTLARGVPPSVDGPFGCLSWPDEVRAWIEVAAGSAVTSLTPYRVGAHEVVLGADCTHGRVYFKGLAGERASEARLTQELAAVAPDSFAQTLALDRREDGTAWWLTASCPGQPVGDAYQAAEALARIQQRVMGVGLASLSLSAVNLDAATLWAGALLGDSPCAALVRRRCAAVMRADVPEGWIPMDLDPSNILIDDEGRVRFIDVDDSFLGPVPLAVATLATRCADRMLASATYRGYELAWSSPLTGLDCVAFETAATVVQFWLGWKRLERNIARGEVYVDGDLAAERTRRRLARAIGGRSPCPARPDGPAA